MTGGTVGLIDFKPLVRRIESIGRLVTVETEGRRLVNQQMIVGRGVRFVTGHALTIGRRGMEHFGIGPHHRLWMTGRAEVGHLFVQLIAER